MHKRITKDKKRKISKTHKNYHPTIKFKPEKQSLHACASLPTSHPHQAHQLDPALPPSLLHPSPGLPLFPALLLYCRFCAKPQSQEFSRLCHWSVDSVCPTTDLYIMWTRLLVTGCVPAAGLAWCCVCGYSPTARYMSEQHYVMR